MPSSPGTAPRRPARDPHDDRSRPARHRPSAHATGAQSDGRGLALLRAGFLASVVVSVVPYGATGAYWLYASIVLIVAVSVASTFVPLRRGPVRALFGLTLTLMLALAGTAVVQALWFEGNPLANPAWLRLDGLTGAGGGAISVDPAATLSAVPKLAAPFLVFMSALVLFQDDEPAMNLWKRLTWLGGAVAVVGLLQFVIAPGTLLLGAKEHYLDSLTGVFVNRNTAATFLGLAALLTLGTLEYQLHGAERRLILSGWTQANWRLSDPHGQVAVYALLLAVVAVALLLTTSRAGIASSFVALASACAVLALSRKSRRRGGLRRLAAMAAVAGLVVWFLVALGARTLWRTGTEGLDDLRWCVFGSIGRAIADNPVAGTGFGAFEAVFPAYRDAACAGIGTVWYRAHSSFLEGYLGLGLIFAVAVVVACTALVRVYVTGMRQRHRYRFAPLMCLAALLLVVLHSILDFSLQVHGVAVMLAAMLGAGAALSLNRAEPARTGAGTTTAAS